MLHVCYCPCVVPQSCPLLSGFQLCRVSGFWYRGEFYIFQDNVCILRLFENIHTFSNCEKNNIQHKIYQVRGSGVAQSVKRPLVQVMISRFVSSSPAPGSVLTARSLEPFSDSVSLSLSAPPPLVLSLKNE